VCFSGKVLGSRSEGRGFYPCPMEVMSKPCQVNDCWCLVIFLDQWFPTRLPQHINIGLTVFLLMFNAQGALDYQLKGGKCAGKLFLFYKSPASTKRLKNTFLQMLQMIDKPIVYWVLTKSYLDWIPSCFLRCLNLLCFSYSSN